MFIDEARIHVASGSGGDGVVHFRREKYVPRGGPDGGNGGKGGDVLFVARSNLTSLAHLRHQTHFKAGDGGRGGGQDKTGRSADDVVIDVPMGTLIWDEASSVLLGDLVGRDQALTVCRGGRGGRGNARFATPRNQAPRMAERGAPGQARWVRLELRLLADIAIVGVPNAGKSTLLSAISNARPKIADYPFTTLEPHLGVVEFEDREPITVADIPGLIEGAHDGAGLGSTFLRHLRRTRALIHLVDGAAEDPVADFSQINNELALFDRDLRARPQVLAINKVDLPHVLARIPTLEAAFEKMGLTPLSISAQFRTGLEALITAAYGAMERARPSAPPEAMPVYRPESDPADFTIDRDPDGAWRVRGEAIERAARMTYWEYDQAVRRFQRLMSRLGIERALRDVGAGVGDTVRIGEYELEWLE